MFRDHRPVEQDQSTSIAPKQGLRESFGVLEDNEGKWPQPELPGANNMEEAEQVERGSSRGHGSGSSRLFCAGSVGYTGKPFFLAAEEPNGLHASRRKAGKTNGDVSSGDDNGGSEKSSCSGHEPATAEGSSRRLKLMPLPGPDTILAESSGPVASEVPKLASCEGDGGTSVG